MNEVGAEFDPKHFADTLSKAQVNSINLFAKCHHGYSYYDTTVGTRHPGLCSDLLSRQLDACLEADIETQIYVSVGWDELSAFEHPEWRQVLPDGTYFCALGKNLDAAWSYLCLNSPYTDYLEAQVRELANRYETSSGFWMDIVRQSECCCTWCRKGMDEAGLDWQNQHDRLTYQRGVLDKYFVRINDAARSTNAGVAVFHNQGHIGRGDRQRIDHLSHLELESLPTGGWGYDHFPLSAKYADTLGKEFLGMTGKFHTVWGEFGGFKHPNALRYECSVMLALGAKCSIGDHLDPGGQLDKSTYDLIGTAYREVAAKEPWCLESTNCAEIAILSSQAVNRPGETRMEFRNCPEDEGASRLLLESHYLFEVIDPEANFADYSLIILPDTVRLNDSLSKKLDRYCDNGGHVLLSGESGLKKNEDEFAIEIGATYVGPNPLSPDFVLPEPEHRPDFCQSPFVMYGGSQRVIIKNGRPLGALFDPYFKRSARHFYGHQHTPPRKEPTSFPAAVQTYRSTYLAHPVFSAYRELGAVTLKAYVTKIIDSITSEKAKVSCNLPSSARITVRHQPAQQRYVLHVLHATPTLKGQTILGPLETIEDIVPLHRVQITVTLGQHIKRAYLAPQGDELEFTVDGDSVTVVVDRVECHQMVVLDY